MTILYFLLLALVAAICGSISQAIVGISVGGCVISAVVGFIGSILLVAVLTMFNRRRI
jgi:uncharacterized membrane protein YeaQ/YmgE (transglycosylase-associated protein family)